MSDNTGLNPEDEYGICASIKFRRSDLSVVGCYRDNVFIDKKDMTLEEQSRAHDLVKKHIFEAKKGRVI